MLRTLAFALLFAGVAAPALAEDFTFVVPVDVRSLPPEVAVMTVSCATEVLPGGATRARMVGSGQTVVPVHGSYAGDVTVTFNASTGVDPHLADGYLCSINSLATGTGPGTHIWYTSVPDTFIPLASGATYRYTTGETHLH